MKASNTPPRNIRYSPLRATLRLVALFLAACFWLPFATLVILIAAIFGRRARYRTVMGLTRPFCRSISAILGVKIRIEGRRDPGVLIFVANHVTWLDIFVAGATVSGIFVSRHDVKDWPVIGLFARLAATVFIDRTSLRSAIASSRSIMLRAKEGIRVVFFPEGGASGGDEVIAFKPFLFGGIVEGNLTVQPLTISYTHLGDVPVTPENKDVVYWYRPDQDLLAQALRMIQLPSVHATVSFREPLTPPANADRSELREYVDELRRRTAQGVPTWGKVGESA